MIPEPGRDAHLVIRGCDVLVAPGRPLREDVDLVVGRGRVAAISPSPTLPHQVGEGEILDGRGLLAIPGLVNAHTHSPENPLRGAGEGLPLEPWLCLMFSIGGDYTPQDHYACALAGAVEMLRCGTTAVVDHLWTTPPSVEAVEAALRAYRDAGMRAAVAPMMGDVDGTEDVARQHGLDPDGLFPRRRPAVPVAELVAQLNHLMARWHGAAGGRLRVLAGPDGVQWCSDQALTALAEVARRHGSLVHTHLLETFLQDAACRLRHPGGGVRLLDALGLLEHCALAHGVWLDGDDVRRIAERGAVVVHNPGANLRLGSGRAPVRALLDAGATVALGTDGSASSDNQVLWDQIKLAALIHFGQDREGLRGTEVLRMATAGGAAAMGLPPGDLGTLEPGSLADVTLLDRFGDGLAGASELEATLALSETGRGVRHVLVGGEIVVRDGRCTRIDEEAVRAALAEQARRRAANRPGAEALRARDRLERLRQLVWEARGGAPVAPSE
jgi:5-methylthioadenosine/S-adenosylhomocysteine deaminase